MNAQATATSQRDWQPAIREQLEQLLPGPDITHAVIWLPEDPDAEPQLLDIRDSEQSATISAEDRADKINNGEVSVVKIEDLVAQLAQPEDDAAAADTTPDTPPAANTAKRTTEPKAADTDPDKGKLFDIPKVKIDMTQPTLLQLAVSGNINATDRDNPSWTRFYNNLQAGKPAELTVTVHVAGAKKTHRRDKEGDVDAVVETKSLIITDVQLPAGDA